MAEQREVLVVGFGYLGSRVARELVAAGIPVAATTRRAERVAELRSIGARPLLAELAEPDGLAALGGSFRAVVYAVAPGPGGDARLCYLDGPLRVADALATPPPERFIYVSSTGVYAQQRGELVDETSAALSQRGHHSWIRAGEEALLAGGAAHAAVPGAIVLRLGGLYGPGRSPIDWLAREDFRRRLAGGRDALMNWIHVDDAASAVAAALARGAPGRIYNVVDGHAVTRGDFYGRAASLAGIAPPELPLDEDLGKRCSPRRMLDELGVVLRYPDYRAGLDALAAAARADARVR